MNNEEHYEALATTLIEATNDYLKHHGGGVRVEVLHTVFLDLVVGTFIPFPYVTRTHLVEAFCDGLRKRVEEMGDQGEAAPPRSKMS